MPSGEGIALEPRCRGGMSMSGHIITVAQHKGGAGKTTLTAHLAVTWAELGRRVAVLDTDPQGSLGLWYRQRQSGLGRRAQPLAYAAATGWRVGAELERLSRISDLVLVDTPPSIGPDRRPSSTRSATCASPWGCHERATRRAAVTPASARARRAGIHPRTPSRRICCWIPALRFAWRE